jgi:hypothetical protein
MGANEFEASKNEANQDFSAIMEQKLATKEKS